MRDLLPADTTVDVARGGARVVLLPVGSLEQHGPHLPLTTDTLVATTLAAELAAAYRVRRLPPITISCSHEHAAWPGTVSISAGTLAAVVRDVAASLAPAPLVVVNAHGGNHVLAGVVQEATVDGPVMALFPALPDWEEAVVTAGVETSLLADMHAGEIETSILLHAHPHLVGPVPADHLADDRRHLPTLGTAGYSTSGVIGRPSLATAEKGCALLAALVGAFAAHLSLLRRAT